MPDALFMVTSTHKYMSHEVTKARAKVDYPRSKGQIICVAHLTFTLLRLLNGVFYLSTKFLRGCMCWDLSEHEVALKSVSFVFEKFIIGRVVTRRWCVEHCRMDTRIAIMHVDVRHQGSSRLIAAGDTLVDVAFLNFERNRRERASRRRFIGTDKTLKHIEAKFVQSHQLPFGLFPIVRAMFLLNKQGRVTTRCMSNGGYERRRAPHCQPLPCSIPF